jgi:protein-L-isoaspartate(D-aspartate) O-methyltransferase
MRDMARLREAMVDRQVARRGVRDERVLQAMREVPRDAFVPERLREFAYEDSALPIEAGQTISQPYIVALMIEAAAIAPGDRVLEIGAGSGYAAAVISRIADRVYAVERHEVLSRLAAERLKRLGYENVEVHTGDGTRGWPEAAPFDAILTAAGGPAVPEALKAQLRPGGRLVIPIGETERHQRLMKLTRTGAATFDEEGLGDVAFVPLIGAQGWAEEGRAGDLPHRASPPRARPVRDGTIPERVAAAAEPLPSIDDAASAVRSIGSRRRA